MRQLGIIQVLLSGFCFGFLGIFGKRAFSLGLSPGEFLSLRFLVASSLLGIWLLLRRPRALRIPMGDAVRCGALGLFGYAVFSSCFFYALQGLSASLTVLLLYTYPVIVALGAWWLFKEKISGSQWIALPLVSAGLAGLVWGDMAVNSVFSLAAGALSSVFYAVYILASSRWTRHLPSLTAIFYIMLAAGVVLGTFHLRPARWEIYWLSGPIVLATALVGTLAAMGLFLAALRHLTNTEVSLLSTAEPVTGVVLAGIWLHESLSPLQWAGGALVIAGMVLVGLKRGDSLDNTGHKALS